MNATLSSEKFNKLSMPRLLLHLEGAVVLLTSFLLYARIGESWWLYALLFFSPDLVFIPYMLNASLGTRLYNIVHSYSLPLGLALLALYIDWQLGMGLALIWAGHIGLDRLVGYGLKYQSGFKDTHFNRI